jgi:hypothetical protein
MTSSFTTSRNGPLAQSKQSGQPNQIQCNTDPIPLNPLRNSSLNNATPVKSSLAAGTSSSHFSFDETMLADDLSTMPVIDERTLGMALKTRYESKKIYVSSSSKRLLLFKPEGYNCLALLRAILETR